MRAPAKTVHSEKLTKFLQRTTVTLTVSGGLMFPMVSSFDIANVASERLWSVKFKASYFDSNNCKLVADGHVWFCHCWHDNITAGLFYIAGSYGTSSQCLLAVVRWVGGELGPTVNDSHKNKMATGVADVPGKTCDPDGGQERRMSRYFWQDMKYSSKMSLPGFIVELGCRCDLNFRYTWICFPPSLCSHSSLFS